MLVSQKAASMAMSLVRASRAEVHNKGCAWGEWGERGNMVWEGVGKRVDEGSPVREMWDRPLQLRQGVCRTRTAQTHFPTPP